MGARRGASTRWLAIPESPGVHAPEALAAGGRSRVVGLEALPAGGIVLAPITGHGSRDCRTLLVVSISESPLDAARRTVAYRAAVWCGRLNWICVLAWFTLPFIRPPAWVVLSVLIVGVVAGLATHVLLRRAGVRFARRFTARWIADGEVRRQFTRDQLWLPPR